MPQTPLQTVFRGLTGIVIAWSGMPFASAQLPTCQPPRSNEPLLLVVTRTPESQSRLRGIISRDVALSVCNYLGETVTRVGGYRDADTATSWANYLNDTVRLRAFVALPAGGQVAAQPAAPLQEFLPEESQAFLPQPNPALGSAAPASDYNPRPLGEGFAVIVNHYNRPEVAVQVQQALNRNIGLVAFDQRPFLLAVHTRDRATADAVMQRLSDRGFAAMLVSSRRLTLLTPVVRTNVGIGGQY